MRQTAFQLHYRLPPSPLARGLKEPLAFNFDPLPLAAVPGTALPSAPLPFPGAVTPSFGFPGGLTPAGPFGAFPGPLVFSPIQAAAAAPAALAPEAWRCCMRSRANLLPLSASSNKLLDQLSILKLFSWANKHTGGSEQDAFQHEQTLTLISVRV